jgi:hypothetical protein
LKRSQQTYLRGQRNQFIFRKIKTLQKWVLANISARLDSKAIRFLRSDKRVRDDVCKIQSGTLVSPRPFCWIACKFDIRRLRRLLSSDPRARPATRLKTSKYERTTTQLQFEPLSANFWYVKYGCSSGRSPSA